MHYNHKAINTFYTYYFGLGVSMGRNYRAPLCFMCGLKITMVNILIKYSNQIQNDEIKNIDV
jgi:hypothetical protein